MKPSDVPFIVCCHACMLFMKLTETDEHKKVLMSAINPRKAFVEVFLQKLEMCANTKGLTEAKCVNYHLFSVRIKKLPKL